MVTVTNISSHGYETKEKMLKERLSEMYVCYLHVHYHLFVLTRSYVFYARRSRRLSCVFTQEYMCTCDMKTSKSHSVLREV